MNGFLKRIWRRGYAGVMAGCLFLLAGCSNPVYMADQPMVPSEFPREQGSGESDSAAEMGHEGMTWEAEHGIMTITPEFSVPEEIGQAVFSYMERYYKAVSALEMTDMEDLFSDNAQENTALNRNTWEYVIGLRAMQKTDLKLDGYRYELAVTAADLQRDGSFYLRLNENSVQRFAQHPDIESGFYNIQHGFWFEKRETGWKIRKHLQSDGIGQNLMGEYWNGDMDACMAEDWEIKYAESFFASRREELLRQAEEQRMLREQDDSFLSLPVAAHKYNREAAVAYADSWVGIRNEDWADFTGQGGNCQNFVSQCLYAGGIPRDISGKEAWSWKKEDSNLPENDWDTLSWINVEAFRNYTALNRGYGLAAQPDAPYLCGEPGDIIQMGFQERWSHTVLISRVVTDREGHTVDYLIHSNTADLKNVPVSAYSLPYQTLTKIAGWNAS